MKLTYQHHFQNAQKHAVRDILNDVAANGFDGSNGLYIAYNTGYPGVQMPEHLRARYPEQITIVLQHQFSNLKTTDTQFSVDLAFGGVPTTLVIPYDSLISFYDPDAAFGFAFEPTISAQRPSNVVNIADLKKKK